MASLDVVQFAGKHAQITGHIINRTSALRTSMPTLDEVLSAIHDLDTLLDQWYKAVPPDFRQACSNEHTTPERVYQDHVHYVAYAYHGSRMAIHSILVHPWNAPRPNVEPARRQKFRDHVARSSESLVSAAREILQRLRHLDINAASPKW
jgi:hypothetical protein